MAAHKSEDGQIWDSLLTNGSSSCCARVNVDEPLDGHGVTASKHCTLLALLGKSPNCQHQRQPAKNAHWTESTSEEPVKRVYI